MSGFTSGIMPGKGLHKDGDLAEKPDNSGARRDVEQQQSPETDEARESSIFKSLSLLDRFLAVWIFLAMLIGILLGNFVPNAAPALQQGKFVGVSVPIGKHLCFQLS